MTKTNALNPTAVRCRAELSVGDLGRLVDLVVGTARDVGMAEPVSYTSPIGGRPRPFAKLGEGSLERAPLELALHDGTQVAISNHPALAEPLVQIARVRDGALSESAVREALRQQAALLRALAATGSLVRGHVERLEDWVASIPSVPIARRFPALFVTEEEVARAYHDSAPFWEAWPDDWTDGTRHLLSRHLDAASTAEWFRACFDDQWAMARAARPGDTFFGGRVAPPGCEDLLMHGPSRLVPVGHHEGHLELAGYVPEGEHVAPWEILRWSEVLLRGQLDDGSPVTNLRVVFRNEAMARREATPLLDMEAQVVYLASDGSYRHVE